MTSPIADIIAKSHREGAWLLAIEGLPYMFTDRPEIAGTGVFSWIGTAYGARAVIEGLVVPDAISRETNLETGMLSSEDGASFQIHDFDGKLIALVADNPGEVVGETFGPKVDPLPTTTLDGKPLWGKWLNHESIGPKGQRRWFACMPVDLPGNDHAAVSQENVQTLALSTLRDDPTWHEGMRCALYFIYRDTDDGSWPSWQTQHDSGYSLVWFGATRELTCEALTWTLECDGPSSWLRRQLGGNRPTEWTGVTSPVVLSAEIGAAEYLSAYYLEYRTTSSYEICGSSYYNTVNDALPLSGGADDYIAAINARILVLAALVVGPNVWTSKNATCTFNKGNVAMQMDDGYTFAAYAYVCLHEKVWKTLGFDIKEQGIPVNKGDNFIVDFVPATPDLGYELAGFSEIPGPGYYIAIFKTVPSQYISLKESELQVAQDNNGKPRIYGTIVDPDQVILDYKGLQEMNLLATGGYPYFEGQTCRPPPNYTFSNSGGDVDSVAFLAFRGSYLTKNDTEPSTRVHVAKVGFKDNTSAGGHGPSADASFNLKIYIERWIDSRWFGIDSKQDWPWSSLDLEFCPINFMGYNVANGDRADLILLRTMLSTGTATWSGYEGEGATLTLGVNAHPDAAEPQGSDVEIADLGLAIPYSLIDAESFVKTAAQLPNGGYDSPLNRVKFAFVGSFDSQQLVMDIMGARGWGMGLVRGQFRLFNRAAALDYDDVELDLTPDDFAVDDPGFIETTALQPMIPRDGFTIEYGKPLIEGVGEDRTFQAKCLATDPQTRTRRTNNIEPMSGAGLIATNLWATNPPQSWITSWARVAGRDLAAHYAASWVMVDVPVMWGKARDLGPGSIIRFTSLYAPGRDGNYGLTNRIGRVVRWSLRTTELIVDLRVLVQAGSPTANTPARFAPMAEVLEDVTTVEARHDAAIRTFYCYGDCYGHGEDQSDVTWFAEPVWSGTGTEAIVWGWQHDGRRWAQNFAFTVESVDSVAHTITYKAGSFSGTWWEARPTVLALAPYDTQPANSWTRTVFAWITRADGTHSAANVKGQKLA